MVEDDERERRALGRALSSASFAVEEADGSQAAISALSSKPFDLLLADINMPGGSGMELLAFVRDRALGIAVVLMTGLPTVDTAVGALRDGAVDYITKPIKPELLFIRLDAAIKKQRVRGALEHAKEQAAAFTRSVHDLNLAMALAGPLALVPPDTGAAGTPAMTPSAASQGDKLSEAALAVLSPREREIALLTAQGNPAGDIASRLNLSTNTVRNHVKSIFNKLRVHSQLELVSKLTGLRES